MGDGDVTSGTTGDFGRITRENVHGARTDGPKADHTDIYRFHIICRIAGNQNDIPWWSINLGFYPNPNRIKFAWHPDGGSRATFLTWLTIWNLKPKRPKEER